MSRPATRRVPLSREMPVQLSPAREENSILPTWGSPRLSIAFLGVAVFLLVVHSYRLPVGEVAIAIGLFGLIPELSKFRVPPGFWWCLLFFGIALISTVASQVPEQSWDPLLDYGKVLLIALVIANALRDRSQVSWFLILWLGCFALWPMRGTLLNWIYGIGEFGRYHWNFIFKNPNDLAGIVLLILGLTLVASRAGGRQIRLLSYIGIALLTFTIFLTQSRGAFLGLMVGALLSIATQRKRLRILLGIGVLAALIVVAAPPAVWGRLAGLTKLTSTETISEADQEGSAKSRYAIWNVALRISRDNPFSGVGFGSYPLVHEDYANRTPGAPITILGRRDTHSTYLSALAETGIFGMLAILGFVIHFGVFLARTTKRLSTLAPRRAEQFKYLLAAWIAFWVAGFFGSFHRIVFPYLFVGFATALAAQYGVLGRSAAPAPAPARGESAGRVPLFRAARSS